MPTLMFNDSLKTGVDRIDEQHRVLVEMINTLLEGRDEGRSPLVLAQVLDEMSQYVAVHFRDEEKFMIEEGFKGLASHQIIHALFEAKVQELRALYQEGQTDLLEEVFDYMVNWLISHIQGDDMDMVHEVMAGREGQVTVPPRW